MIIRAALAVSLALIPGVAPAAADPGPGAPEVQPVSAPQGEATTPVDDGKVASSPPQTTTAPDGSTLTISAKDETQLAVAPLTTAISTREYVAGGFSTARSRGAGARPAVCSRSATRSAAAST